MNSIPNCFRLAAAALALIVLPALLPSTPAAAQDPAPGSIINATFTSGIAEGAPVDFRDQFSAETRVVYFYAEVLDLAGQTVKHRWSREGTVAQEVPIALKSPRQAAWSSLTMRPDWTGNWTVEVVNGRGEVIGMANFAYNP